MINGVMDRTLRETSRGLVCKTIRPVAPYLDDISKICEFRSSNPPGVSWRPPSEGGGGNLKSMIGEAAPILGSGL